MNSTLNERPEMDDLLHDYFQAEMPSPWPSFAAPRAVQTKPAAARWTEYTGRIVIAACLAGLLAGYMALGGYFPRMQGPTGVQKQVDDIGLKDKGPKRSPTIDPIDDAMPTPLVPR